MNFLLRLVGTLVFLAVAVLVIISVPVAKDVISCYDRSTETFDDVELRSRKYNWEKGNRCLLRQQTILELELCIEDRFDAPATPLFLRDTIMGFTALIRPNARDITVIQTEHNADCSEFPDSLFILPQNDF